MEQLGIGLIGCGKIAQAVHLPALARMAGARVVALAEADAQRRAASRHHAPAAAAFAEYHELLAQPQVDAVVICLPPALHAAATVAALEHGKHVYLEKPLATSCAEAQAVLLAWEQTQLVGMIGFNYRFNALYEAMHAQVRAGAIGQPIGARTVFTAAARGMPAWKQQRASGGGVLLDLASHHIDLTHMLFDAPIAAVSACVQSRQSQDDSATLTLRLADGMLVQSFFALHSVDQDRFEIYGERGTLAVDRQRGWNVELTRPGDAGRLTRLAGRLAQRARSPYLRQRALNPRAEPSYQAALERFVAVARGSADAYPSLRDGYRSLAVVEAAEESVAAGRLVHVQGASDANPVRF